MGKTAVFPTSTTLLYLPTMMTLTPHEKAQARHHAYTLIGRLFVDGLTPALLPFVQQVGELTAVLPTTPFDEATFDEAAAAHQHLFGFNLFPYASIFLASDGLLGGNVTEQVVGQYQRSGFVVDSRATSPDHIGHELQFLAFLSAAEADAWRDGLPQQALRVQQHQRDFLQSHLLHWLLPLVTAVSAIAPATFYVALADLALQLVLEQYEQLCANQLPLAQADPLPQPPDVLAQEKTGLRRIARYLTVPPYSGIYLSRDQISQMARQHDLPRGFGSREEMLENVLVTAVQYDTLPNLLGTLHQTLTDWVTAYQQHAALAPFMAPWLHRIHHTQEMLAEIKAHSHARGVSEMPE